MSRLSRKALLLRWTLPLWVALFLAMWALSFYLYFLNRRITRELGSHNWREPTVIASASSGKTREIVRVYGSGWRITPPVRVETLPPHVANAFLAAEDVRFRRHLGLDPIGIFRALFANVRAGGIAQGGSTIPQQIVKQRFLTNERTWRRKFIEAILAVVLDARLSKDDILELYLNDVYLGHHDGVPILGIDEASRLYFEKTPRQLRVDEAALLAAMIRAPNQKNAEWIRQQSRADPLQVAILSIDPKTGGVRALVGGTDFRRSPFDRTSQMRRQPGSAFKPFAYLAAIASKRVTASTLLLDAPVKVVLSNDEVWEPQNYDEQFRGRVTLREAFERSLNVPTVRMTNDIGPGRVVRVARQMGIAEVNEVPAMPLGVGEVTMRELTAAYTAFPNLGERVEPFLLRGVSDRDGKTLFEQKIARKRVVDAGSAYVMHTLLRGVVRRGTATRLKRYGLAYVAGKTGTTNDYRDAWFVGYTADMVTSVWVGFDRGAPLRLSSSEAAIPVWGSYMREIPHRSSQPAAPAGVSFRAIDPETGMLWRRGCPGPIQEVFLDGTAPTRHCPTGIMGRIVRRVLFDDDHFDEPAAITFDKFRRWANDADRNRQQVEGALEKLQRIFE